MTTRPDSDLFKPIDAEIAEKNRRWNLTKRMSSILYGSNAHLYLLATSDEKAGQIRASPKLALALNSNPFWMLQRWNICLLLCALLYELVRPSNKCWELHTVHGKLYIFITRVRQYVRHKYYKQPSLQFGSMKSPRKRLGKTVSRKDERGLFLTNRRICTLLLIILIPTYYTRVVLIPHVLPYALPGLWLNCVYGLYLYYAVVLICFLFGGVTSGQLHFHLKTLYS